MAMRRRLRHEAAPTGLAQDQPVGREPLHRVPGRHPAHPELGTQVGVGGQALARTQRRDPLAKRLLDVAVLRRVAGGGHRLAPVIDPAAADGSVPPRSAASNPWIAAPIAPAHVPSCAVTISTSASDVVWTRRVSSAWIGPIRRSIAAETPPPSTTRSGESATTMLAMPIPR